MGKTEYDIFISYRRKGGKNYARTLKPELEKRGFRVFLDFDELKDGVFDKRIMDAISQAPVFMVILSEGALDRCVDDSDWVRLEILYADKKRRHIVPIEFDKTFREFPTNLPDDVKSVLGAHQFSQIDTETLLQESVDKMVRERVKPYVATESEEAATVAAENVDGAEIHIESDADLNLYRFGKLIKKISANGDNVVFLKPGKHKLEFVSQISDDVRETRILDIPNANYSDMIEISLQKEVSKRVVEKAKAKYENKEYKEAFELFSMAAEHGDAVAQYYLGLMHHGGLGVEKNYEEAAKWLRKAAEQGHAHAQYYLGYMYRFGRGVAKNYEEAAKWLRKAAEQGDGAAQYNLGDMYYFGESVEKNSEEAAKWYRKAAEQGYAIAQCDLGARYYYGIGVEKNIEEAAKWYRKAAEQGHEGAKSSLEKLNTAQKSESLTKKFFSSFFK